MKISHNVARSEWIDILKGFLLLCIVFSHFGSLPVPMATLIKPTGDIWVPTFFFLSGMLFNEKRYSFYVDFVQSKFKSLLLPYLFLFLIFVLLDWNLYLKSESTLRVAVIAILNADGPPKAAPLWFVIALFEINMIYFFIARQFKGVVFRVIVVFACSIAGYIMYLKGMHPILGIDVLLSSITFFGLGHLLNGYIFKSVDNCNQQQLVKWVLLAIFLAITAGVSTSYNPDAVLGSNKIHNFFLFYLTSLCGTFSAIIFCVILWSSFSSNRSFSKIFIFFRYIALQGLTVLASHVYIIIVVNQVLDILEIHNLLIVTLTKIFAITILTYYFIVPFVHTKLKFIFGKDKWSDYILNRAM